MANQIIRAEYTSDNGTSLTVGINSELLTQLGAGDLVKLGYSDAGTVGMLPLPRQMKPRRVVLYNPAGKRREIICFTAAAPLFTGVETTLDIEDSDGASTTYTRDSARAEQVRKRRKTAAV